MLKFLENLKPKLIEDPLLLTQEPLSVSTTSPPNIIQSVDNMLVNTLKQILMQFKQSVRSPEHRYRKISKRPLTPLAISTKEGTLNRQQFEMLSIKNSDTQNEFHL